MKAAKDLSHQQACDLLQEIQLVCQVALATEAEGSDDATRRDLRAYDDVVEKLHVADLV